LIHSKKHEQGEGVVVRRPDELDFNVPVKTPDFEVPRMNTSACPRDLLLTLGNEVKMVV
jgi:glycine amidinotransferase